MNAPRHAWLLPLLMLIAVASRGEDAASSVLSGTLRFRRVMAPADQVKQWPTGDDRYLPIAAAEFEDWVDQGKLSAADDGTTTGRKVKSAADSAVQAARYELQLGTADVLTGSATLDVRQTGREPQFVTLDPLNMAVDSPRWLGEKTEPAVWGSQGRGPLLLRIEQSGQLKFRAALRGQTDDAGNLSFDCQLPSAPANHLQLDLPAEWTPDIDGVTAVPSRAEPSKRRGWTFTLGALHQFKLKLARPIAVGARRISLLRQTDVYAFTPRGVELASQLKIDMLGEPLPRLTVLVDRALTVISVDAAGAALPWTIAPDAAPANAGPQRVVIELPNTGDGQKEITVKTACSLTVDRKWKLPTVRVPELTWQEQTATLQIGVCLAVEQLNPIRARQTKITPAADAAASELIEIQSLAADSEIELRIDRRTDQLQLTAGVHFELRDHQQIQAQGVYDFSVAAGERFTLDAVIPRNWSIDSVQTVPAGSVVERSTDRRANPGDLLSIRLAKPLAPGEPLRVSVTGHRLGRELAGSEFRWLTFNAATVTRQLAAVVSNQTNHQLKLTGSEELSRLDPRQVQLSNLDRALLGDVSNAVIFELNDAAASAAISSVPQPPRARTEIVSKVTINDLHLTEEHDFNVRFESGVLNRLVVRFSESRSEPLEWSASGSLQPQAKRIAAEPARVEGGGDGEVWELTFAEPPHEDFHLHAVRTLTWADDMPINLASMDEVTSQRGTIEVRNDSQQQLEVMNRRQNVNRRLKAIVSDRLTPTRYSNLIAAFHYEPTRDVLTEAEPALRLKIPLGDSYLAEAWAWRAELIASCPANADARYMATYWLENRGQRRIHLTVPSGCNLNFAAIDGEPLALRSDLDRDVLTVELPTGRRFVTLTAYFSGRGVEGKWSALLQPVLPALDVAILARRGQLHLPPELELVSGARDPAAVSPNWPQRIFGALARPDGTPHFDPLAPLARGEETNTELSSADRAAQITAALIALGEAWQQSESRDTQIAKPLKWAELLDSASQRLNKIAAASPELGAVSPRPWLVDRTQLAQLGISAQSKVLAAGGETPGDIGAALLAQSHLALSARTDAIVLTRRESAAFNASMSTAARSATSATSLAAETPISFHSEDRSSLLSLNDWKSVADVSNADPWSANSTSVVHGENYPGWNSYAFELSADETSPLQVVNAATRSALSWAIFFATVGLLWKPAPRHKAALIAVLVVAASVALLAPDHWRPLVTAIVLGCCATLITTVFRIRRPDVPTRTDAPPTPADKAAAVAVGGLLLCVATFGALQTNRAWATPPSAASAPAAIDDMIFDVLMPVNDQGKVVGEYYYVPQRVFDLLRAARLRSSSQSVWLLTAADYRGDVEVDSSGKLAINEIKATFNVRTWEANAQVMLPLGGEGASLLPGGVTLDGKPASIERNREQGTLLLEIDQPGQHQQVVRLHPHSKTLESGAGIEMSIPELPTAQAVVTGPAKPSWEITSSPGGFETTPLLPPDDDARVQQTARLGRSSQLRLHWNSAELAPSKPPEVKADELLRLHLQPGFATLDARLIYQVARGKLSRLRLFADPSLQLLRLPKDSPVARISRKAADPRVLEIELKEPAGERLELELSFLIAGFGTTDKLNLPLLQNMPSTSLQRDKRLLGLWVDAALEETVGKQLKPIAIGDFSAAWGREFKSQTAYQLPTDNLAWNVSVKPREAKLSSRQILAITCETQRVRLAFGAALTVSGAYRYGYRVFAPKDLEIDSVSVREGAMERVDHWSRDETGVIQIFLNQPAYGEQKLTLFGSLLRKGNKETEDFRLPAFKVDTADLETNCVLIRRRPDVQVSPADASLPLAEQSRATIARQEANSQGLLAANLGRVQDVACLLGRSAQPGSVWRIAANRPAISSRQVVTLSRSGDNWQAALDFHAEVRGGEADAFYFWVSSAWRGPFEISQKDARVKLLDVPGESKPLLLVQPAKAIRGEYQIGIRGPVTVAADERVRAPEITPTHAGPKSLHFVLPNQLEMQELHWDVRDLRAQPNPPGQNLTTNYEVTGSRYRAQLQSIDRIPGIQQVRLAEFSLARSTGDALVGVASFDLSPAGLDECVLQLPESYRLIHASLGGQPTSLTAEPGNRWKLPLGRAQLPQRVEAIFTGHAMLSGIEQRKIEVPRLIGLTPDRTVASIYWPDEAGPASLQRASTISTAKLLQTRIESDAGLLSWAASANLEEPQEEIDRWSAPWLARLRGSYRNLQLLDGLHQVEITDRKLVSNMSALAQEQAKLADRLASPATIQQANADAAVVFQPSDLHAWSQDSGPTAAAEPLICSITGEAKSFTVQPATASGNDLGRRLIAVLLLLTGLTLTIYFRQRLPVQLIAERWPHMLLAVAGLAWWLWLKPSWLGWPIMLLAAVASLLPSWRDVSRDPRSDAHATFGKL